jgi:hypothetical protein
VRREQNTKEIPGLSTKTSLETQETDIRLANRHYQVDELACCAHLISVSLGANQ